MGGILSRSEFQAAAQAGANAIPLIRRLMSDQLTPVLGYRRLVSADDRVAPSFLFESVENGAAVGRHSFVGAQPTIEVTARGTDTVVYDHRDGAQKKVTAANPLDVCRDLTGHVRPGGFSTSGDAVAGGRVFTGGWVGFAGYDTVRYVEGGSIPFDRAPRDDRGLPDVHFALYRQVAVFDHVDKVLHAVHWVMLDEYDSPDAAYDAGSAALDEFVHRLETHSVPLPPGAVDLDLAERPDAAMKSNFERDDFEASVERCREYIAAGDAFQIVISQRFERQTTADPFEIYRALRIVNPSPYMIYLQAQDAILVASSPEILCRVERDEAGGRVVTNRPLAGTRRRGASVEEDAALEQSLRVDAKERAEHIMLVDLGRNDLGRVCDPGTIELLSIMDVERYSHVMHLSSTIVGRLRAGLTCWDALRNTLPVGTVSGAPKIRAMQIIDELEPTRRGPYAGGIGAVSFGGDMDIALALRTMVIPTNADAAADGWTVHLQAGAGIVADSDPAREYEETVNKAAGLGRAIDLAERAFG